MTGSLQREIAGVQAFGLILMLGTRMADAGSIKVLHAFCNGASMGDCSAGANPQTAMVRDKASALYGTLPGGYVRAGSVFELSP
jgi:hypothetical protein